MLPEQVDLLPLQPRGHCLVHLREPLVACVGEAVEDLVAEGGLGCAEVLIALGVLGELLLRDVGDGLAVDRDDLVLFIEQLHKLRLPLQRAILDRLLLLAEEDEAAVALDVDWDALEREALRDGGLHLADGSPLTQVHVHQRAILTVHDEVPVGAALDGNFDEIFDGEAAGPGWIMRGIQRSHNYFASIVN